MPKEATVATAEAAALLMLTPRRVQQLAAEGHVPRGERGRYPLKGLVHGYLRFLQEEARRTQRGSEESELRRLRLKQLERRMAREDRLVVLLAECEACVDEVIGMLRSDLDGLPARATRDLDLRRKIEAAIDGILGDASRRLAKAAGRLGPGGVPAQADGADEPGDVGAEEPPLPAKRRRTRPARPEPDAVHDPVRGRSGERPVGPRRGGDKRPVRKDR